MIVSIFLGSTGTVSYSNVSPANYKLSVVAKNSNYDTVVTTRLLIVPDSSYSCAVNLIDDGILFSGDTVTVYFAGVGKVSKCACYLNQQAYNTTCKVVLV